MGGEELRREVEVLGRQVAALGECCRAEKKEDEWCGCAGVWARN